VGINRDTVYVAVALWRGLVDEVGAFRTGKSANDYIKEKTGKTLKGLKREAESNPMADWAGSCVCKAEVKA
jgi:hypothetical protein